MMNHPSIGAGLLGAAAGYMAGSGTGARLAANAAARRALTEAAERAHSVAASAASRELMVMHSLESLLSDDLVTAVIRRRGDTPQWQALQRALQEASVDGILTGDAAAVSGATRGRLLPRTLRAALRNEGVVTAQARNLIAAMRAVVQDTGSMSILTEASVGTASEIDPANLSRFARSARSGRAFFLNPAESGILALRTAQPAEEVAALRLAAEELAANADRMSVGFLERLLARVGVRYLGLIGAALGGPVGIASVELLMHAADASHAGDSYDAIMQAQSRLRSCVRQIQGARRVRGLQEIPSSELCVEERRAVLAATNQASASSACRAIRDSRDVRAMYEESIAGLRLQSEAAIAFNSIDAEDREARSMPAFLGGPAASADETN